MQEKIVIISTPRQIGKSWIQEMFETKSSDTKAAWPFPTSPLGFAKIGSTSFGSPKFSTLAEIREESGIKIMHVNNHANIDANVHKMYSYTVAYRPTVLSGKNTRMVDIAIACCSPKDNFCKKTGAEIATNKFLDGEYITLPLKHGNLATITDNIGVMLRTIL